MIKAIDVGNEKCMNKLLLVLLMIFLLTWNQISDTIQRSVIDDQI